MNLNADQNDEENEVEYVPIAERIFISYSNIYVFSGPLNECHR